MYSAGLISGSGSIDCLFNSATSGVKETPLLMLQLINRVDIGSEFDLLLSITEFRQRSQRSRYFLRVHRNGDPFRAERSQPLTLFRVALTM
jgi:hypothetical protein